MALPITQNLREQLSRTQLTPLMVMRIDGYPTLFGNVSIKKYIKIGDPDLYIGDDWVIGGFSLVENQSPYIQFNQGTTTRITQKLDPSRGQGSSVSSMTVNLVDFVEQITELVSPGFVLEDVLNRTATIWLGAQESSWPDDYNVIFRGVIAEVSAGAGFVELRLNNTDEKKRVNISPRRTSILDGRVNFRSVLFQDVFFQNREDIANTVQVTYVPGGTAGSEVVSLISTYHIQVQIQDGVSTASQVKRAVENSPLSNQLVSVKVEDGSATQTTGTATLGTDTTITLEDAQFFSLPADSGTLRTYVRIGQELIEYTGKSGNQLTGCVRGALGSEASVHQDEAAVDQVIRLTGNGVDLALKLMLSRGPEYFAEVGAKSIVYFTPTIENENTIFFDGVNVAVDYGVAEGDIVDITGALPANNLTGARVIEVGEIFGGSFIVLNQTLISEPTTTALVSFKSEFNTLPIGAAMVPSEVDVEQHLFVRDTFLPTFELDLFFDEISEGKGFLEREVYLPMTCFSVPRKGRSSIVYTTGPFPTYEVVTLDLTTVKNPEQLKVSRSINENFHNAFQVGYDLDPVANKFTKYADFEAESSTVDSERRVFSFESRGLRTSSDAEVLIDRAARRWLRRYESGAEYIKGIKVMFSVGYQIEIGDVVLVDFQDLKLSDFSRGNRQGSFKLMEVLNKTLDNKTGEVTVDVVNTTFGVGDRFGLISPATELGPGSTTTKLVMRRSWGTRDFEPESKKWSGYLGQRVQVRPPDFSSGPFETFISGFDNADPQGMLVNPPLPVSPGDRWIVECINYPDDDDQSVESYWKARHAFFSPQVAVVAGISNTRFTVAGVDVTKFFVGSVIRVHNYDYTVDSPERTVVEIDGNDVIVSGSLGFVPSSSEFVDLIGFPDKQQAYRVV